MGRMDLVQERSLRRIQQRNGHCNEDRITILHAKDFVLHPNPCLYHDKSSHSVLILTLAIAAARLSSDFAASKGKT